MERFIPELWAPRLAECIESVHMYSTNFVRRTWRERLFSWPWRPWHRWRLDTTVEELSQSEDRVYIGTIPSVTIRGWHKDA